MTPERWQQVEEACLGDPDLRGEVDSLLAMQGPAAHLMTRPALASAGDSNIVPPPRSRSDGAKKAATKS